MVSSISWSKPIINKDRICPQLLMAHLMRGMFAGTCSALNGWYPWCSCGSFVDSITAHFSLYSARSKLLGSSCSYEWYSMPSGEWIEVLYTVQYTWWWLYLVVNLQNNGGKYGGQFYYYILSCQVYQSQLVHTPLFHFIHYYFSNCHWLRGLDGLKHNSRGSLTLKRLRTTDLAT